MVLTQLHPSTNNSWVADYTVTINVETKTCGNSVDIEKVYLVGEILFALGRVTKEGCGEAAAENEVCLKVKLPPNAHVTNVKRYFIGANAIGNPHVTIVENKDDFFKQMQDAIPVSANNYG